MLDQVRRDTLGAGQRATAMAALAAEHGFVLWQAAGVAFEGWGLAERGRAMDGIKRIQDGLDAYRATGAALFVPYFLALLGTTHGTAGRAAEGVRLLAEALHAGRTTGERWFEAEVRRLTGELLRSAGGDRAAAEACFLHAVTTAQEQGARLWELRATTSLARLRRDQGRRAEAHDLLARIHGWFSEGFDTPDLKEAGALLDELASTPHGQDRRGPSSLR
jgi:predicted ATPase